MAADYSVNGCASHVLVDALQSAPKTGTIAPNMSTVNKNNSIGLTLFGKTRRAILSLLFGHAEDSFYMRQIARAAGVGMGAVQRELKNLADAGIIMRIGRGRQVYYQANPDCPVFAELKGFVVKTAGVADVLRAALVPLADGISKAFIYGSFARGSEKRGSDIDVLVVGEVAFSEVVSLLASAQKRLGREVNPTVYPPDEFTSKAKAGNHFIKSILKKPKIFLIGDEDEFEGLAQ